MLTRGGLVDVRIAPAPVSREQRDGAPAVVRLAIDAYTRVGRTAAGRLLLTAAGPSFIVTARAGST